MFIIRHGQRVEVDDRYVLKPGETLSLPALFMDHAIREERRALGLTDAYGVVPAGHRPGYVFVTDTSIRDAAANAYEERNKWMENAWRHRHAQQDHDQDDRVMGTRVPITRDAAVEKSPPARTLADAQAAAERAYHERNERMRNAWKDREDAA
jgi:hypothetical protein